GLDKIETLQSHQNQEVYQKSFDIIEHYFGSDDEVNDLAPQVDIGSKQYTFNNQIGTAERFEFQ
uniref:Uncharacterized protein n=1 Tax=Ciona savignyi TaxID=51511 RepID=H2YMI7_CIOSA